MPVFMASRIAEATSRIADMSSRTQIAYGQALVAKYQVDSTNAIQKAGIAVEAAKALRIPEGTAKWRLRSALRRIGDQLRAEGFEEGVHIE